MMLHDMPLIKIKILIRKAEWSETSAGNRQVHFYIEQDFRSSDKLA